METRVLTASEKSTLIAAIARQLSGNVAGIEDAASDQSMDRVRAYLADYDSANALRQLVLADRIVVKQ